MKNGRRVSEGRLIKTNIEDETFNALQEIADRHDRRLAAEVRVAIRAYVEDHGWEIREDVVVD